MLTCRLLPLAVLIAAVSGCGVSPRLADSSRVDPPGEREDASHKTAFHEEESEDSPVHLTSFQAAKSRHAMRKLDELILFQPAKYPAGDWSPRGLNFRDVELKSADGTKLHAWFCPTENSRASVLYLHGNAGHLASRADFLKVLQQDLRVDVLIVDYRGYGKSEGKSTIDGAVGDVRAASRELASRTGVKEDELIVWGRSLGGALAIQLAGQTQPRGVILHSSFSSLKETAAEHFPKLAWMVGKNRLNSVEKIAQYKGAVLQCHGTNDRVISFASGKKLHEAANEPKEFLTLEGRGHNDRVSTDFLRATDAFISRLTGTGRALR